MEQAEQDVFSTREAAERLCVSPRRRGGELTRRAESDHYQVLIDGFAMIRALQASGAISDLEVIVVTALTQHTIAERGGLSDRITVLHKPLRFEQLRQRLLQLIELRKGLAAAG